MSFEAFLLSKKIDPDCWQALLGIQAEAHKQAYEKLGAMAYFQRYLFLINRWRRACPLHT